LLCSHSCTCKLWHSHIHELACPHVSAMLARVCTCAVWSFFILLLCTLFLIKHCAVGLLPAGHFLPPCMLFSIKHCAISPLFAGLPPPHSTLFFVKHCARARYSWSLSETTSAGRLLSPSYVVTIISFGLLRAQLPLPWYYLMLVHPADGQNCLQCQLLLCCLLCGLDNSQCW